MPPIFVKSGHPYDVVLHCQSMNKTTFWLAALFGVLVVFLFPITAPLHEFGHILGARIAGDHRAHMVSATAMIAFTDAWTMYYGGFILEAATLLTLAAVSLRRRSGFFAGFFCAYYAYVALVFPWLSTDFQMYPDLGVRMATNWGFWILGAFITLSLWSAMKRATWTSSASAPRAASSGSRPPRRRPAPSLAASHGPLFRGRGR